MSPLDRPAVFRHLEQLEQHVHALEEFRPQSYREFISSPKNYWAVEHGLQLCIQSVLDIGSHLLAALTLPAPEDYKDVLIKLGENGILPPTFVQKVVGMAGFRNVLVHEYLQVDLKEVYQILQNGLDDFRSFAGYIIDFLASNNW